MAAVKTKKAAFSSRACANCGALDDPPDTTLSACARCHLVFYCSRPCQVQHWKQKPAGHKQFCVTPEERRPAAVQCEEDETNSTLGTKELDPSTEPASIPSRDDECAICLEPLNASSAGCCTLPCSHVFHVLCAEGLRSFGIAQVCPMCRAELPPGPGKLFEDGCRLYFPLRQILERNGGSWSKLTAAQRRKMGEVLRDWKGAVDQGHAGAQCNLGAMYANGQGVPQNFKEALVWYRKAADQGDAGAQFNLGVM